MVFDNAPNCTFSKLRFVLLLCIIYCVAKLIYLLFFYKYYSFGFGIHVHVSLGTYQNVDSKAFFTFSPQGKD